MSKIICIDAGHGGADSGAVSTTRYEKNDTLRFSIAVEQELAFQGFTVIQTRTADKGVSLKERTDFANAKKADFFISLHRNAFVTASANGVENWIYQYTDALTQRFAEYILEEVVKVGAQANRGVKRGNYHVVRETNMPACLLELGFISNTKDNQLFDTYLEQYAVAIAKGVCKYLDIAFKEKPVNPNEPDNPNQYYRVQVGAFLIKANAEALMKELKAKGYPAIIVSP